MKSNKLIAFAEDFVAFLIEDIELDKIRNIILFGSVARGEATKESDIDLFVDIVKNKNIEKKIKKIKNNFYKSTKYKNYWELLDVKNNINMVVGDLSKWKELKPSILANGITLYGKYKEAPKEGKHKVIFAWEDIKPASKRVMLSKKIFGYKYFKKFYEGLLQTYNGKRISKGCIIVPLEHSKPFEKVFKYYKITPKIFKIFEYK